MSNKLILYNFDLSPAVRTVKIVAKILGLELELRNVNLLKGEQMDESFIKINPEHVLPTLDDNGFIIWDSLAISTYLVDKYGKDDSLYPKDLQLRAKCNQRLFFNTGRIYPGLISCSFHVLYYEGKEIPKHHMDQMSSAYDILEAFLTSGPFLVGDQFTIADISVALTVSYTQTYVPLQDDKHSKILAWLERVDQTIPFFEEYNTKFKIDYRELVLNTLEKNKIKQFVF